MERIKAVPDREEKNEKRFSQSTPAAAKEVEEFNKSAGIGKQMGLNCREES